MLISKTTLCKAREFEQIELNINDNLIIYLRTMQGVSEKDTLFSVVRKSVVLGSVNIRIAI